MFIIILTFLLIFGANFAPNHWFIGWDNLHPEFNFALNINRSIFAVWQEYQGLGLLGGMGHASDILRQLFLLLLSLSLPTNWLRQIYMFAMLLAGSLGVYFLAKNIVFAKNKERQLLATAGGLFYLLNLATLQIFFLPFSAFATHFGLLPWLLLTALSYYQNPTRNKLLLFTLASIISTPQAYVPTLFLVYVLILIIVINSLAWQDKKAVKTRISNLLIVTFLVNAFWLMPFAYFNLSRLNVVFASKINQMATETNFLENKQFGDLLDVLILKGFLFDKTDLQKDLQFGYLLANWKKYTDNPLIIGAETVIALLVILGIYNAFRQKNRYRYCFLSLFLLGFTLLANSTPPFSWIDSILYKIPLFAQVFRFPFTKFAILTALAYAVFFSFGIELVHKKAQHYNSLLQKRLFWTAALILILTLPMLPIFRGELFYKNIKLALPAEYKALFDFYKSNGGRIANFPQHTFWGWNFYNWGYRGSGFLWYGIANPILDRAFDVWNVDNEAYYWEVSYAIYTKNQKALEATFNKYNIKWILVDKNIINPQSPKSLYIEELEKMFDESDKIQLVKTINNLKIYKYRLANPIQNFVYVLPEPTIIQPTYQWSYIDQAYIQYKDYITTTTTAYSSQSVYYPFRSLLTIKKQKEAPFEISDTDSAFIIKHNLPHNLQEYQLFGEDINNKELPQINPNNLAQVRYQKAEVTRAKNNIQIIIPKTEGYLVPKINLAKLATQCKTQTQYKNKILEINSKKRICEIVVPLPNLPHKLSYIITIESKNIQGQSLLVWLENLTAYRADFEIYLPKKTQFTKTYIIQPPMQTDGLGYVLHIKNMPAGSDVSINAIKKIEIYPFPYWFIKNTKLIPKHPSQSKSSILPPFTVQHPNPSLYIVNIGKGENFTLALSQSWEKGWQAYNVPDAVSAWQAYLAPIFGQRLNNHVLVNNWANGWTMKEGEKTIVILYLPQYLEFFGFLLLLILPVFIIKHPSKVA